MSIQMLTGIIALLSLLAASSVSAAPQKHELSWEDIESVLERHPAIRLADGELLSAKAEIGISSQYPNPEFSASMGQGRAIDGSDTALTWGIELEIPIDAPGAYLNDKEAAEAAYSASRQDVLAMRLEVRKRFKGLFYRIAIGQEVLRVAQENLKQVNRLVEVARLRVEQGEARPMEVDRLEVEREKLSTEAFATESNLISLKSDLNIWLGNKLPYSFKVAANWKELPSVPLVSEAIEIAIKNQPSLIAVGKRIVEAEAQIRSERHRIMPELKLGGFYDREMDAHNYGALLGVELPLWNWNRGAIAKARADRVVAGHRKELAQRKLVSSVHRAHAAMVQAVDSARRYANSILPKARRTAKELESLYRVGETDIIDVIDSRRSQNENEIDMLAVLEKGWLAYFDLMTLMGGDHE